ncbi:MAG: ACP S-malonyltransferase [Spirochaetales bacterium]|nr:ACP S-malonyltransferase [Spirochaetales bacterium]
MKTCILFPGQGAQYSGMGRDLFEASAKVKELFVIASETTNLDTQKLLFEASEEELKETDKTQVAVTLMNLAAATVLEEHGIVPDGCAGFSLGEYSALCIAGIIEVKDLFPLVKMRGEFMEKASRNADTAGGNAGMAAVIGLAYDIAFQSLEQLHRSDVFIANHTSPVQVVLAGTQEGLAAGAEAVKAAGARRVIPLKVSGPFHTPLLQSAQEELEGLLSGITFRDPGKTVYSNVTGGRITSADEAKHLCVQQVTSSVLWVKEEQAIQADGYARYIEAGPGTVLKGLWKAFTDTSECRSAGKMEEIVQISEG